MLRKIRSDIVSSMDEESFYLISMIDVLLKKKIKNVTRNFSGCGVDIYNNNITGFFHFPFRHLIADW